MNCDELRGAIYGYTEKQLPSDQRAAFEQHLEDCPPCKELVGHVLELPCRDFVQFLDDYHEDRLSDEQRKVFDKHMELCPPCLDYLRSYETTVSMGRMACSEGDGSDGKGAPSPVPEALVKAIMAARKAQ